MSLTEEEITGMFISYVYTSLLWRKIDFYSKEQKRTNLQIAESFEDFEENQGLYLPEKDIILFGDLFDQNIAIQIALKHLTKKERFILHKKFYIGLTDLEIAKKLNISSQRVSQLKRRALIKMKIFLSPNSGIENKL
ncbi:sigma-70 family RNA polymerase sigma factor [Enterococcus durans]|uniref:sigma-70 family RNA polymerase sigma factor n=1 Tax=Enterococcus durans TaxID=53345 RepID=UPI001D0B9ECF|nr:sigma-70 family RNA polymerase sigma factor [Enterococcus durans]MCB8506750.1 sigma-70 family RNA polymerase sigma factor [Enterococcus durans]